MSEQAPSPAFQSTITPPKVTHRFTNGQWAVLAGAVLLTMLLRLVNSPVTNFGSMVALTLLCGSVTRSRSSLMWLLLPLGIRVLTDVLVHLKTGYGFFPSWPFDYSAYVGIFLIGRMVPTSKYAHVIGGAIVSVAVYFVLSNLGVWFMWSETYPRTPAGLLLCFTKALPFARGTIYGNLLIAPALFLAWNMATSAAVVETEATPAKAGNA